jgi:hypothetical protein
MAFWVVGVIRVSLLTNINDFAWHKNPLNSAFIRSPFSSIQAEI